MRGAWAGPFRERWARRWHGDCTAVPEVGTELPKLTNEEIARYSRHLILPEVGMEGQQKLKAAKVLCVGTGGLGCATGHVPGGGRRGDDWSGGL